MLEHLATHLATPLKMAGFNLAMVETQAEEARKKDEIRKAESTARNSKWRQEQRKPKAEIKA